jgi:beta-galactosidase
MTGRLVAEMVHAQGAEVVATFSDGLAAGSPALTRNRHGSGEAWYVATMPDPAGIDAIVGALVAASRVQPVVADLPPQVEAARRGDLVTLINHGDSPADVVLKGTDAETGAPFESRRLASQDVLFATVPVAARPVRAGAPAGASV